MAAFWTSLTEGVTNIISISGSVVDAIFAEAGALNDLQGFVFLGLSVSFTLLGVKLIKSLVYGI